MAETCFDDVVVEVPSTDATNRQLLRTPTKRSEKRESSESPTAALTAASSWRLRVDHFLSIPLYPCALPLFPFCSALARMLLSQCDPASSPRIKPKTTVARFPIYQVFISQLKIPQKEFGLLFSRRGGRRATRGRHPGDRCRGSTPQSCQPGRSRSGQRWSRGHRRPSRRDRCHRRGDPLGTPRRW